MNVLHVIPAVAARYGGPSIVVVEMCRALERAGVGALLVTTDADGPSRLHVPLEVPTVHHGVQAVFFRRQFSEAFKYSAPLARGLERLVPRFDAVHVHAVFSHACLVAGAACRARGVPYVVRPLGTLDPWSLARKKLQKRLFWHAGGRALLDGAAAVHYTTVREKELAEQTIGRTPAVVVPCGVEDVFTPGRGSGELRSSLPSLGDAPFVLFVSRLHPKKGVELLLDAFARATAVPELQGFKLVVAGTGDTAYVESLEREAERLGVADRTVFAGWLEGTRKLDALRSASLFALPSKQENFGVAVAEAMACGTPVLVSTDVNLADEIAQADAGWVAPLEPGAFGNALRAALRDVPALRHRGGAGALLVEQRFRWPGIASRLADVYRGLASAPRQVA